MNKPAAMGYRRVELDLRNLFDRCRRRVVGVTQLSPPQQNSAWLAKYDRRVKWFAPFAIVFGS